MQAACGRLNIVNSWQLLLCKCKQHRYPTGSLRCATCNMKMPCAARETKQLANFASTSLSALCTNKATSRHKTQGLQHIRQCQTCVVHNPCSMLQPQQQGTRHTMQLRSPLQPPKTTTCCLAEPMTHRWACSTVWLNTAVQCMPAHNAALHTAQGCHHGQTTAKGHRCAVPATAAAVHGPWWLWHRQAALVAV
jgi:hypothetical protein